MRFDELTNQKKDELSKMLFEPIVSSERLKDWVRGFLGLELPLEITDPDSTSSPLDAVWQIYKSFKDNSGDVNPGYILLSCREGMKTVSVAILETLLMLHFQLEIAHAAAIEAQSSVGLGYISDFIAKVRPLMEHAGWVPDMANKRTIKFKTPQGKTTYIKVLICTVKGMNSLHVNALFLDELDLADPKALKQARNIVGYSKGIFGITVYLSTRKYAFGNMNEAIESAQEKNYKIIRWNILDVTEACPPSRHLPDGPKEDLYVALDLPLRQISKEEYSLMPDPEKPKWSLVEQAHEGCLTCPLLAVCQKRLSEKPQKATGGFYKPIVSVIQKFRDNDPDTAEAELMCFSENTQILMGDGTQKNIKDVSPGDEVITHTGSVKKVTETFKRYFSGSAFKLNNFNWRGFEDTIVTSEHPFFVDGEKFESISNIKTNTFDRFGSPKNKGNYFSLPSKFEGSKNILRYDEAVKIPHHNFDGKVRINNSIGKWIPDQYELTHDFGWIVGFYLAEGFAIKKTYKNRINTGITFCSHVKETVFHDRVRNFAASLGFPSVEFKSKESNGFTQDIQNSSLAELFIGICGEYSYNKKILPCLMFANMDFLSGVLKGFYDGDGTKRVEPHKELTTTSYSLASQLFVIASRLGLCPRVKKSTKQKDRKQVYRVYYTNTDYVFLQKRTKFIYANQYNQYRIDSQEILETHHDGYVYNIEVKDDHSYIANGVSVHNCWRPGSEGLVYPRFISREGGGNVISYKTAFESLTGDLSHTHVSELTLIQAMHDAGVQFVAGVDWGYTHDFTIIIMAIMTNGEVWVVDCFAAPGLEMADMLRIAIPYRDKYRVQVWYCDPAYPANCKTFTRNQMRSPKFTKDVMAGIESIRSKITNGVDKRFFKIINRHENKKMVTAMTKHRFILDGQGNITTETDDARGIADLCDALRYIGQNKFPIKGSQKPSGVWSEAEQQAALLQNPNVTEQMKNEIATRIVEGGGTLSNVTNKKGGFLWNF